MVWSSCETLSGLQAKCYEQYTNTSTVTDGLQYLRLSRGGGTAVKPKRDAEREQKKTFKDEETFLCDVTPLHARNNGSLLA